MRRHKFMGKEAIALHMRARDKNISEKLHRMSRREEKQTQQQAESLTSTVSHEMRTPIMSIIFFLQQVLSILQDMD